MRAHFWEHPTAAAVAEFGTSCAPTRIISDAGSLALAAVSGDGNDVSAELDFAPSSGKQLFGGRGGDIGNSNPQKDGDMGARLGGRALVCFLLNKNAMRNGADGVGWH